jgi:hypothetical protein
VDETIGNTAPLMKIPVLNVDTSEVRVVMQASDR